MNEWNELKIDNLPPDILTGDYEFEKEYNTRHKIFVPLNWKAIEILRDLDKLETKYRYRRPEPKVPTHEEIMSKWWKNEIGEWFRIAEYCGGTYAHYSLMNCSNNGGDFVARLTKEKSWFIGRESADIPPESE